MQLSIRCFPLRKMNFGMKHILRCIKDVPNEVKNRYCQKDLTWLVHTGSQIRVVQWMGICFALSSYLVPNPPIPRWKAGDYSKVAIGRQKIMKKLGEILWFPLENWTRIRTNNVIERLNRKIRRRTRVVGCFLDGNSALMQVCCARLQVQIINRSRP